MPPPDPDLSPPFGSIDGLDSNDIQASAYELLFTSCRSSPGFGGRNAIQFYSSDVENGPGSPSVGVGMGGSSRVKRVLGLKLLKRAPASRRSHSCGTNPLSPSGFGSSGPGIGFSTGRSRRPFTSAEIMRQQMKVSESSDNRLRKTLMRTLVGQVIHSFLKMCIYI